MVLLLQFSEPKIRCDAVVGAGGPVATVAVNGASNAALLAVRILAVADLALAAKLDDHRAALAAEAAAQDRDVVGR